MRLSLGSSALLLAGISSAAAFAPAARPVTAGGASSSLAMASDLFGK